MTITGCVVAESLRTGSVFEPPPLRILRIDRVDVPSGAAPAGRAPGP